MRKSKTLLLATILVFFSLISLSYAENSLPNLSNFNDKIKQISEQFKKTQAGKLCREDEIIIKFKSNYQKQLSSLSLREGIERVSQKLKAINIKVNKIRRLGPDSEFYLIKFDKYFHSLHDVMQRALHDSEIEFAEPNYMRKLHTTTPNDFYNYDLWGLIKIRAPEAWDITKGSEDIVVAVIDSGVDYTHEDLAQNIWINPGEIPNNGIDDDGNGYVDDIYGISPGYNGFTEGISISDPMDTQGHGTHVAGIIGARGNNSRGLVGVNWNIKISPCMAADPIDGILWTSNILECFAYIGNLKSRGVNIKAVNASYGGEYSHAEELSIQSNLRNKGILLITSAGNESKNNDLKPQYPCNYALDNIICVASTDRNDNLSIFSNYGNSVHVAAPGQAIYSTYPLTADNFDYFSWNQIFYDNFESGTANWDSSHPSISGLSTNHYMSPNHSITDSVSGNYPSNSEIFIGSRNIDLTPYRTYKVWSKVYAKPFLVGEDIAAISFTLGSFDRFYTPLASNGDTMIDEGYYGKWNSLYLYVPSQLRKSNFGINFILISNEDTLTDDGVYWDDVGVYYSSSQTNFYSTVSGTSMATPFVTGLSALIWAKEPSLSYLEVKNRILSTVDVLPQLSGKVATSGRINAYKALGGSACTPPFPDVPCDYWAVGNIQWIKDRGITTGYPDGTFRPEASVKRSEMAAFIIRALEGESFSYPSTPYFTDVTPGMWHFKYVQRLRQRGLTTGCNSEGTMYCPEGTVTRAQMAAFLVRAKVGESFSYSTTPYFSDVPSTHWAFRYIQKLKELGITTGYGDGRYGPEDPVTRAQMATFLYRAFGR